MSPFPFNIKIKEEWFGGRIFIKLRMEKCILGDSRIQDLLDVLCLLRDIWLKGGPTLVAKEFKNIANQLKEIVHKVAELQGIYNVLNGPGHEYISSEEQSRLLARGKEITVELEKVSA